MRPERLEVAGFTAFRDPVEIDFEGADLFALTGPTGAGKSSVIDAITFALYGSVPRYGDQRLVAPVITQGRVEARVRLDFSVGGERYTAVRVVRAGGKGGATTKEARLERADGEVLAGDADGLTQAVERLLGLRFEHFTTCVVLPQGEFARFLHEKPGKRQDLLVELLDLGLYERMGALARQRREAAANRVRLVDEQLAGLALATPEARAAAAARVATLEALEERIEEAEPTLAGLAKLAADARVEATTALERARLLGGLTVPEGVDGLADDLAAAAAEAEAAASAEEAASTAVTDAEAALAALPARAGLEASVRAHDELADLRSTAVKGQATLEAATTAALAACASAVAADEARATPAARLETARVEHRAADLAAELRAGEPCPVCRQVVTAVPEHAAADLDTARAAAATADETARQAAAVRDDAERELTRVETKLAGIREHVAAREETVADLPEPKALVASLAGVTAAEEALAGARAADRAARERRAAAERRRAELRDAEVTARHTFDAARDTVAALEPPPAARRDLAADWAHLVTWSGAQRPVQEAVASEAQARAAEADRQAATIERTLADACAAAGVTVGRQGPLVACAEARTTAVADVARIDRDLATIGALTAERAVAAEAEQVAGALGQHLSAKGFEKWVLDEALTRLVEGATELLHDLSNGAYSLCLDPKTSGFLVVDHRNAGETRSARTLSGGETFLASLALALALADEVAAMASRGSARLESIFLDEGFGTLDPDTLDVVATAIEELGSTGRMVGLVSHVRELAERVPVRFEVRKGPHTSTVEKVVA